MCDYGLVTWFSVPPAVRADRMRGGRNKFGPLYRRDRQMKQQRVYYHPNTAPCRIKLEGTQTHLVGAGGHTPSAPSELHRMTNHTSFPLTSDPFYQSQSYAPTMVQSDLPMILDCTMSRERAPAPSSLSYPGLYHRPYHGYRQQKGGMPFSCSPASAAPPTSPAPNNSLTPLTTPTTTPSATPSSTPCSTPAPTSTPTPTATLSTASSLLLQLQDGEPDEAQLCAKVLASLQREQASRGKHDCLNTFSIMCKMADQTLFGLVEWARNSPLFKELKVTRPS